MKDFPAAIRCAEQLLKVRPDSRALVMKVWPPRHSPLKTTLSPPFTALLWLRSLRMLSKGGSIWAWPWRKPAARTQPRHTPKRCAFDPNDAELHINLGVACQDSGDKEKAMECYRRALQLDPDSATALWNLALLLAQQRSFADAEKLYTHLLNKAPDAPHAEDSRFRLGCLRLELGDFRGAAEAFDACLWKRKRLGRSAAQYRHRQLETGGSGRCAGCFPALPRGSAAFERTHCRHWRQWHSSVVASKSMDLHAKLVRNGERSPEVLYNAGLLHQKSGQPEQAVQLYREALVAAPEFAEALLNLGIALESLGQKDEAQANWQKALTLKPELAHGYFQ